MKLIGNEEDTEAMMFFQSYNFRKLWRLFLIERIAEIATERAQDTNIVREHALKCAGDTYKE